jgi:PrtD family type I secretion system ABC transporter
MSASPGPAPEKPSIWKSPSLAILFENKRAWMSLIVFSLVINTLMLAPSIYMMQVMDRVIGSRNVTTLVMLSLLALILFVASGALEWARSRIIVRIGVRFDNIVGAKLLEASHRLGIEKNGGAGSRLMGDLSYFRNFITGAASLAILDVPWVPIYFFVTLMLHPKLALLTLGGAVIMFFITLYTERVVEGPLAIANERNAAAQNFAATSMRNAEIIESMGMFGSLSSRWQERQNEYLMAQAEASDRASWAQALSKFVRTVNQSATMTIGAFLVLDGDISPGVIFAASMLTGRMLQPIDQLTMTWSAWSNAKDSWVRIDEALALPEKKYSDVKLPAPNGELVLEGVFGGPPQIDTPFVQNVSLKIPAGASVAIIGSSASGKSTLLRIIAGVWAPRFGTVRIDGADLRHWRREELGPYIGYVPQDVILVEGSIGDNISRHGEIDSEKVITAAKAAGVHEMILNMREGYNTQVGAGGTYLSGGQRQRIALARALYGQPRILILDEPNANLDEAGELALDNALDQARKNGQTVLIVSHRPVAIRNCDLVMVMQAGQVTLYGPREQVFNVLANAAKAAGKNTAPAAPAQVGYEPA